MNQSGASAQDALLQQAGEALSRHDPQTALGLIDQADRMGPTHHGFLNRALALRMLGDLPGALAALDDALAIQPYDFTALLGKAAMLEHGAVYLAAMGGAGAMLNRTIKNVEIVAFEDLGSGTIRRLTVEDFPATAIYDLNGNDYYEIGRKRYAKT